MKLGLSGRLSWVLIHCRALSFHSSPFFSCQRVFWIATFLVNHEQLCTAEADVS